MKNTKGITIANYKLKLDIILVQLISENFEGDRGKIETDGRSLEE